MTRSRFLLALAGVALFSVYVWRSEGFFQPDEYFQTIEFASHKLGITPASGLAWEFATRSRSFFQAAVYAAAVPLLRSAGVRSPHALLLALRGLSALVGLAALLLLYRALAPRMPDERSRTLLLAGCLFTWFLPFLLVRTSCEAFSSSFLAMGLSAWLLLERRPLLAAVTAGVAMGLSFAARYQVGFAIAGFFAWLALVRRPGLRPLALFPLGVAAAIGLGLLADRWGFGAWTFTPWNYFFRQVVEGHAANAGREPVYFYLVQLAVAYAPMSTGVLAAALLFWWKAPRDPITWITLPFLVAHTAAAHKDLRYLLPVGLVAAAMAPLLLLDPRLEIHRLRVFLERPWGRRLLRTLVALDVAFLVGLLLVPLRHDLSVQKRIWEIRASRPDARMAVIGTDPYDYANLHLWFIRPPDWQPDRLESWAEAETRLAGAGGAAFIVTPIYELPPQSARSRLHLRLVTAPVPEAIAGLLAGPLHRTGLQALWEAEL